MIMLIAIFLADIATIVVLFQILQSLPFQSSLSLLLPSHSIALLENISHQLTDQSTRRLAVSDTQFIRAFFGIKKMIKNVI